MDPRRTALTTGRARPTPQEIAAAEGLGLADLIAPGLKLLFCGINPGLYSAAVGHHFARPGNRFWPALAAGGVTERLYSPYEESRLLARGAGITNLVNRATRGAADLERAELAAGARALETKAARYRPRAVVLLGLGAYRTAFGRPRAGLGRQPGSCGPSELWVLPSPSGANAYYQPATLVRLLRELWARVGSDNPG